ncbi:MAG TPA: tetratricopeptide repeat protein [Candidatus Cloacimonadota bacterium]|nr:tetratricopeptide repeat protein [Candidatus Cloacimonadota bacterium]
MNIKILILTLVLSLTLPLLAKTADIAQSYALEAQADYVGALDVVRELSTTDVAEPFYQVRIAWLEYLLGRYERSISSYRKAISLRDNLDARVGIINCHLALGDYRPALNAADSLLVEQRQNTQLLAKAAYAAYMLKEYSQAADYYKRIIQLYPWDMEIRGYLVNNLYLAKRVDEAKAEYRLLKKYYPLSGIVAQYKSVLE